MRKASRKTLKKECTALMHDIVLARADNKCERCGGINLLCASHIKSKGTYRSLEYDPDNLKCLCYRCHIHWWHKEPTDAIDWLKDKWPGRKERLDLKAQTLSKIDLELVRLDLKQQLLKYT